MKYLALSLLALMLHCGSSQQHGEPTSSPAPAVAKQTELPSTDSQSAIPKNRDGFRNPKSEFTPPAGWTEITDLDPTIRLDLRYATDNNFVKEKMYDCGRCYFRTPVAKALVKAHKALQAQGHGGLKMYDCYRPRPIQWKLWNKVPDPRYVADPRKGSMHNRGMAADLTIVDSDGNELDMGTDFDFFGEAAYHACTTLPKQVLDNRKLLLNTMASVGMKHTTTEWWHYSYRKKNFAIDDWVWECP
jgi:D-alanyl-D-alanine dipeptidase